MRTSALFCRYGDRMALYWIPIINLVVLDVAVLVLWLRRF